MGLRHLLLALVLALVGSRSNAVMAGPAGADAAATAPANSASASTQSPQWNEIYDILKANLAGATPGELNRAAVAGLLDQLGSRVTLIQPGQSGGGGTNGAAATGVLGTNSGLTTATFERSFGYIRLAKLGPGVGTEFQTAFESLSSSNKLQGLVLDLRFTGGGDYDAAVAVADRFFTAAQDLVDWGQGMKRSTSKSNAVALPTTVLVNRQSAAAAEVLAGILRFGDFALLVGTNTAGQASLTKDFPLKTGQTLRVATAPVKVMGDRELPYTGLQPDIVVGVPADDELLYMADAYRAIKRAGNSAPAADLQASTVNARTRRRMNEAELVRMTREGQDVREAIDAASAKAAPADPAGPQVADPTLARAIDMLKGLAVIRRFRGP